jgi:type IV pilus modification protein PilV
VKSYLTYTRYIASAVGRLKKNEGFTLIEVLMAVSILSIGLLAVASLQISAIKVNSSASDITKRSTWAQDKLEELIALPYSDSKLAIGSPPDSPEKTSDGHTVEWSVVAGPVSDTKQITVTVTNRGKTIQMQFMKADLED